MVIKDFKDCYLYSLTNTEGYSIEKLLFQYVYDPKMVNRINKASTAFQNIRTELKSRATSAVIYRILSMEDVKLCMSNSKELPASYKVFRAIDKDKKPAIFIDCTGLIQIKDGMFTCREIDKLATYLTGAMTLHLYYNNNPKLTRDALIQKVATTCFIKMLCAELDNMRIIGYIENKERIQYITGVYFAYAVMGLDIVSAHNISASVLGINLKKAKEYDFWYDPTDDFVNIDTFITMLSKNFKMEGLKTSNFIGQWVYMYGKGSMYGTELLPSFLNTVLYAYSGTYLNNLKRIETVLGRDMVALSTQLLKIGTETYSKGFKYESGMRESYEREIDIFQEKKAVQDEVKPEVITKKENDDKKEQNDFGSLVDGEPIGKKFDSVFDGSVIKEDKVVDFLNDVLIEFGDQFSSQDIENLIIKTMQKVNESEGVIDSKKDSEGTGLPSPANLNGIIKQVEKDREIQNNTNSIENKDPIKDENEVKSVPIDKDTSFKDKEDATNKLDTIVNKELEDKKDQADTSDLSDGEKIKPENN